jgi:hypothetical protein
VIRGGAKSGEAMRGSARRAPGWPWGRGSAAVELRGLAGGRLPRWRSAWSKGNGYGGARPWAAALCSACHRPALAARVGGQPSAALCLWPSASTHGFFFNQGQYCLFAAPLTPFNAKS